MPTRLLASKSCARHRRVLLQKLFSDDRSLSQETPSTPAPVVIITVHLRPRGNSSRHGRTTSPKSTRITFPSVRARERVPSSSPRSTMACSPLRLIADLPPFLRFDHFSFEHAHGHLAPQTLRLGASQSLAIASVNLSFNPIPAFPSAHHDISFASESFPGFCLASAMISSTMLLCRVASPPACTHRATTALPCRHASSPRPRLALNQLLVAPSA